MTLAVETFVQNDIGLIKAISATKAFQDLYNNSEVP